MGLSCPNKNDTDWKNLVLRVGENKAYGLWNKYSGNIPKHILPDNSIIYNLKALNILQSDKAKQVFEKGKKNNWDLNKILTELQIPKEQKQIILDKFQNRKIYSNIQVFESLNKDDFKGDKLALALWNNLSGLNLSKIEDLIYEDIKELVSLDKPLHSFITGSSIGNKVTVSDFLNQKSIFPKHVIHLGDSRIYPNYNEKLKEVKGDLNKTISEIFDNFKSEQNNSNYQSFVLEDSKGNLYKIDADFISGFVKLANHIESLVDIGLKQEIKNKVNKTKNNNSNSFISKEEVGKNTINTAIASIKNIEIQKAINRYNIPVKYYSDTNDNRAGFFSTGKSIVYINENITNKDLNEVIGHELTHAVTHYSLKFNKEFKYEIEDLFNKAKKATNNEYYGLTNLDEFLAEGFNNKEFISFLQNTKETKTSKLTLFERFINSIYKLFKGKNKYDEKSINISLFNQLTNIILKNKNKLINIKQSDTELNTFDSLREEIITSLLAENSFVVEVNVTKEPTKYYSNLTVPGGTNYTENEIATPYITHNIKGHAQFSTDNGIGWFRNDEKAVNGKYKTFEKQDAEDITFDDEGRPYFAGYMGTPTVTIKKGTSTKTRRILEVQSDLFQKGRDKKDLVRDNYVDENTTKEDFDGIQKAISNSDNQFLQLLNKKNNWVTFFIKSIIQDSAKKGYEKALFPKGGTAAKIEGHQTLEKFKNSKNKAIEETNKKIQSYDKIINKKLTEEDKVFDTPEITKAKKDKESALAYIKTLEVELANAESGQTQLSSIANFYETTVTNILKKNGYNPVEITDEHGNKWNEVKIESMRLEEILNNPLDC